MSTIQAKEISLSKSDSRLGLLLQMLSGLAIRDIHCLGMPSTRQENRIHCTEYSAMLLEEQCPSIPVLPRGIITVSGKGEIFSFFVNEAGSGGM